MASARRRGEIGCCVHAGIVPRCRPPRYLARPEVPDPSGSVGGILRTLQPGARERVTHARAMPTGSLGGCGTGECSDGSYAGQRSGCPGGGRDDDTSDGGRRPVLLACTNLASVAASPVSSRPAGGQDEDDGPSPRADAASLAALRVLPHGVRGAGASPRTGRGRPLRRGQLRGWAAYARDRHPGGARLLFEIEALDRWNPSACCSSSAPRRPSRPIPSLRGQPVPSRRGGPDRLSGRGCPGRPVSGRKRARRACFTATQKGRRAGTGHRVQPELPAWKRVRALEADRLPFEIGVEIWWREKPPSAARGTAAANARPWEDRSAERARVALNPCNSGLSGG